MDAIFREIRAGLDARAVVPFVGQGVFDLVPGACPIPRSPQELVAGLTLKAAVPGRIRHNLTASAQYIESRRHRKTLETILNGLFRPEVPPTPLHTWLAGLAPPLIVDVWYDDTMARALAGRTDWGQVQGLSHPQSNGEWVRGYGPDGTPAGADAAEAWTTVLYKPMGAVRPQGNYLISDSDLVEVLTEIDIQSPIPPVVRDRRAGRHFLFLGCRFDGEVSRTFARQIAKRAADRHWAVLPDEPTRNEVRFMEQYGITRIGLPLAEALARLAG